MKFEKDARKTGVSNLLFASVVILALISLQIFIFSRPDIPTFIIFISWLVGGFFILVFTWQGLALLKSGGKWLILIDEKGINWSSPNESIDKSFDVKFSDIAEIQTRQRTKKNGRSASRDYVLILHNGSEIKLSPNSGINLVQVVLEIERKGVHHEFVRT